MVCSRKRIVLLEKGHKTACEPLLSSSMPHQQITAVHLKFSSGTSVSWKMTSILLNPLIAKNIGLQPNALKPWPLFARHFHKQNGMCLHWSSTRRYQKRTSKNPAQLLAKLSHHYLGGQPLIQSTCKFLRIYPSVTHSRVFGTSEVQFSLSSRWLIAKGHLCYWLKWCISTFLLWYHLSQRFNVTHVCPSYL